MRATPAAPLLLAMLGPALFGIVACSPAVSSVDQTNASASARPGLTAGAPPDGTPGDGASPGGAGVTLRSAATTSPRSSSAAPIGSAGPGESSARASGGGPIASVLPKAVGREPLPVGPGAIRMSPPVAESGTVLGCETLSDGGRRVVFSVRLVGGTGWTVLPEFGPTAPGADGRWTVEVDQTSGAGATSLRHVTVGGGAPFTTALVTLGVELATC